MDAVEWLESANEFVEDIPDELYSDYMLTVQLISRQLNLDVKIEYYIEE